ncbi:MAG: radical SAM protein [Candidatus Omnitrophica bacterium]|nr:radical SAM protein [Candidatus Omnitrophota bacterium]
MSRSKADAINGGSIRSTNADNMNNVGQPVRRSHFVFDGREDECLTIEIYPTMQCPVGCAYCDRGNERSRLEDFSDIRQLCENLLDDVARVRFRISGGEPTFYPHINEMITYLHDYAPDQKIELVTNLLAIERVKIELMQHLVFMISVYPDTIEQLRDHPFRKAFWENIVRQPLKVTVTEHEDLEHYGTQLKQDFDTCWCFAPVLLCGTRKVYPCCRAHRLEQMYGACYHYMVDTEGLFEKLEALVRERNMCQKCPRLYADSRKIPLATK